MSKILVIDDERAIRNTLKEVLEYEKHEVDLAEDGPSGLELFGSNSYDIVLCDIKMPKLDGIEFLQKSNEINPDVPVIMISGHGNIETAVEAVKKGERHAAYLEQLQKLAQTMKITAKCGLGQSVANSFFSIVENFKEEMIY